MSSTSTSTSVSPRPRRVVVRFSPTVHLKLVPSLSSTPPSILASLHYSEEESETMQRDLVVTIRSAKQGQQRKGIIEKDDDDDTTTVRGLEALLSPAAMEARRRSRDDVINAVLDEQDRQRAATGTNGVYDDDAIAAASRRLSRAAVQRALAFGLSDATFVRRSVLLTKRAEAAAASAPAPAPSALERALKILNGATENKKNNGRRRAEEALTGSTPSTRRHSESSISHQVLHIPTVRAGGGRARRAGSMPGMSIEKGDGAKKETGSKGQQQNSVKPPTLRRLLSM